MFAAPVRLAYCSGFSCHWNAAVLAMWRLSKSKLSHQSVQLHEPFVALCTWVYLSSGLCRSPPVIILSWPLKSECCIYTVDAGSLCYIQEFTFTLSLCICQFLWRGPTTNSSHCLLFHCETQKLHFSVVKYWTLKLCTVTYSAHFSRKESATPLNLLKRSVLTFNLQDLKEMSWMPPECVLHSLLLWNNNMRIIRSLKLLGAKMGIRCGNMQRRLCLLQMN